MLGVFRLISETLGISWIIAHGCNQLENGVFVPKHKIEYFKRVTWQIYDNFFKFFPSLFKNLFSCLLSLNLLFHLRKLFWTCFWKMVKTLEIWKLSCEYILKPLNSYFVSRRLQSYKVIYLSLQRILVQRVRVCRVSLLSFAQCHRKDPFHR